MTESIFLKSCRMRFIESSSGEWLSERQKISSKCARLANVFIQKKIGGLVLNLFGSWTLHCAVAERPEIWRESESMNGALLGSVKICHSDLKSFKCNLDASA